MVQPARSLPLLLALLALGAPLRAAPEASDTPLRELLVLEPFGRPARTLFQVDPVEAARVAGTLARPVEGAQVRAPDGTARTWRRVVADDRGVFPDDPAFQGGTGFASLVSERERVVVLATSGPARLFVNGEPRTGDVYGTIEARVPVVLRAGANDLLLRLGRGVPRLRLLEPPSEVFLSAHDATLPDVRDDGPRAYDLGVLVTNAGQTVRRGLQVTTQAGGAAPRTIGLPPLAPLSIHKAALVVDVPATGTDSEVAVRVGLADGSEPLTLTLKVRLPSQTQRRTFVSALDGSVQTYALTPARPDPGATGRPGLVLTLHGASVDALDQARAYAPKAWAHIVAPTNRRPFGFDWEGWGRADAREVLARAEADLGTDPRRTVLTGHSMGGHGTWMIGAQSPGRFAALAPSAGWRDVWTYGGAPPPTPGDPVAALFDRAANVNRLALWEPNLALPGVYVLHGDADDNVPVSEARAMRERLGTFHPNFAYYEQPGAGHWWGDACVDWPPLFAFLERSSLPADPAEVRFVSVDPTVCAGYGGVTLLAQLKPREVSTVRALRAAGEGAGLTLTTTNVRALTLAPPLAPATGALHVVLDGAALTTPERAFVRDAAGVWAATPTVPAPKRAGVFQDAFGQGVVLVYGTQGSAEENAWSLAKARYDAETLWYRGNGAPLVLADADPALAAHRGNRVLYGTSAGNAAFAGLAPGCPIQVERGGLRVGERRLEGTGLLALFAWRGQDGAVVGVVAPTGAEGRRLADALPFFATGVAYPDWCVLASTLAVDGVQAVRGAGYFAPDGTLGSDLAWR